MIERLTRREKNQIWATIPADDDELMGMLFERLAAYEDTNRTPAEITDIAKVKAEGRQWISVTERLPEHSGLVLTYYNCGTCDVSFIHNGKWYGDCDDGRVTHWMPLPEPPKAAEAEKERAENEKI
jgi:hypothetical protein